MWPFKIMLYSVSCLSMTVYAVRETRMVISSMSSSVIIYLVYVVPLIFRVIFTLTRNSNWIKSH